MAHRSFPHRMRPVYFHLCEVILYGDMCGLLVYYEWHPTGRLWILAQNLNGELLKRIVVI